MSCAVLITKRASRFWDGEIILIDRSHPLDTGERLHGFVRILRHHLVDLDRVNVYGCLGACWYCTEGFLLFGSARPAGKCRGRRVELTLPRSASMIRYKGPLPPPHLITEYP